MTGSRSSRISAQRGISMVVVVILFLITLVLTFTTILVMANTTDKEQTLVALDNEDVRMGPPGRVQQLQSEQARMVQLRTAILPPTGLSSGGGADVSLSDAGGAGDLPEVASKEYLGQQRSKILAKHFGEKAGSLEASPRLYGTLQNLVVLAASRVVSKGTSVDQARMELSLAEERKKAREENNRDLSSKSREYDDQLNTLIGDLRNKKVETEGNTSSETDRLQQLIDQATAELDARRLEFGKMDTDYNNRVNKLQNDLEELKVRDAIKFDIHSAHGRIISPDVMNKLAFIDLGSRDRIVPGLKFLVAKKGKQGKFVFKGKVEVKKVWLTYSEVAITKLNDANQPIVDGDLLVNPLFHPRRPVVVAFLGQSEPRKIRPAWTTNEASRRIMEIGSVVKPLESLGKEVLLGSDSVSEGVPLEIDFVIYTESRMKQTRDQDPIYKLAVLIGVPVAEASDMYQFLED